MDFDDLSWAANRIKWLSVLQSLLNLKLSNRQCLFAYNLTYSQRVSGNGQHSLYLKNWNELGKLPGIRKIFSGRLQTEQTEQFVANTMPKRRQTDSRFVKSL